MSSPPKEGVGIKQFSVWEDVHVLLIRLIVDQLLG